MDPKLKSRKNFLVSFVLSFVILLPVLVAGNGVVGITIDRQLQHPCSASEQLAVTGLMDTHNCASRGPRGN